MEYPHYHIVARRPRRQRRLVEQLLANDSPGRAVRPGFLTPKAKGFAMVTAFNHGHQRFVPGFRDERTGVVVQESKWVECPDTFWTEVRFHHRTARSVRYGNLADPNTEWVYAEPLPMEKFGSLKVGDWFYDVATRAWFEKIQRTNGNNAINRDKDLGYSFRANHKVVIV